MRCGDPDTAYSFYNNIIWGNSAHADTDVYLHDERKIYSYSFNISNNDFSVISHDLSESSDISETANIDDDPLFVSATDLHLQEGSPVIDMGNSNAPSLPDVDLDGNSRISGESVDMGVYEFDSAITEATAGDSGCNAGIFVPSMLLLIAPLLLLVRKG